MTTWWWPTQVRILVRVAAPSFSISPTARASGSRSRASTRTYALTFGCSEVWGWPVRMPRALILRTPSGLVSPSRYSWWAIRTDVVVELFEDQGVAGGFEVGGAEEVGRVGVGQRDVPAGLGVVLPVFVGLGVVGRDRLGDETVDDDRAAGAAVGEVFVDPDRGGLGEAVGLAGDPAGLPGRHLQPGQPFPEEGEAVAQVEGVGDQLGPGRRGHAQRQRERFRGERRHRPGCRRRPVTRRPGAPRLRTSRHRCRSGGVEVGPVGGEPELEELAFAELSFGCRRAASSTAAGVEVADLVLLPDRGAHGTKSSIDHRQSRPRIPCIHRGFSIRDLLVTWPHSATAACLLAGFRDGR